MDNIDNNLKLEKENRINRALQKQKKSIFGYFMVNFRLIYLLIVLICLGGIYAIFTLPKEADPEVKVPYAVITTVYPGANPTDIETLITDKIEDKVKNVDNIKTFSSSSSSGVSSVFVEFEPEADIDKSINELKDAVDLAKNNLPSDAEDPYTAELNFNNVPIVTYSLVGDYGDLELKNFADTLKTEIESVKDVSEADIVGGIEKEYQVIVDQKKLANYNLSLAQLVSSIRMSNFNLPSGDISIDDYNYGIRVEGKFQSFVDLQNLVVAYYQNAPIYLTDVAEVVDGFKEKHSLARIGFQNEEAQNTISLQVYKKTGGNILNIVKNTESKITELEQSNKWPDNLKIVKTNDNSVYIKDDVNRLGKNGLQTMILIVIILFAVLGLRGSFIAGLSVPLAFLMAFIMIMFQGMTINSMVLFSLVLSLGLMVDNAIIIMEGINEYIYKHNKTPKEAALLSVWNYKWPIMAGTLTTVSAFLPMLLVSGIMGEYISILPKTITATLLSSLFVSLVIIPVLAGKFYKRVNSNKQGKVHRFHIVKNKLENLKIYYDKLLRGILASKKKRKITVWIAIVAVIVTILLPVVGIMKIEMFPKINIDWGVVNIELPVGSSLAKTNQVALEVEKVINTIPELDNYVTSLGNGYSMYAGMQSGSGEYLGNIVLNFVPAKQRDRTSYEIFNALRPELAKIQGADVSVEELTAGPPTGAPIEVKLTGYDLEKLSFYADQTKEILANIPGTLNIADSINEASGEFTFKIKKDKVKFYGLDATTIASTIRQAVYGVQASKVTVDGDDIDITVKYSKQNLEDVTDLNSLLIPTMTGQLVQINQLADLTIEPSVLSISHIDGEKIVQVTGDIAKNGDIRKIYAEFEKQANANMKFENGYSYSIGGEMEDIQKSFTEIFTSMFLAIFLILFILILQFNSYKQPFIIIFSLPLAIVGAIFGLTILGLSFSLPAFIGLVSLSGIVVNDAIVLIDRINKNLKNGEEFIESIVEAGKSRMQPIFLTSLTTVFGILPLALSDEMWRGLGFSIIFGLIFSTILILIYIPIFYNALCKKDWQKSKNN